MLVSQMGVAAVIHIHVFPAEPYKHGERCERNVAVMADYAALETPPDAEEVQDCERSPTIPVSMITEGEETHPKIHQSVCDVLLGSGGIVRHVSFSFLLFKFTIPSALLFYIFVDGSCFRRWLMT